MTKKGKRTTLLQYQERINDLERENAALKAAVAAGGPGPAAGSDSPAMPAALEEWNAVRQTILENINEGMIIIQDGVIRLARFRAASIQTSAEDVMGKPFLECVHPEDRQSLSDYYARRQRSEDVPRRHQFRFLDSDGSIHWIEVRAALLDWEGRPATLALLTQIDDRKQAELALKASEEKYRLLIEKTRDVIWTAGLDLALTYVSPSVEQALGFTPEEHLQRDMTEQLTPESLARARDALREHLEMEQEGRADPERSLRIDLEYYRKDGSTIWMEQNVSGLRDARGALTGIHGVARDIRSQKEAQQALEGSERKYRQLIEHANEGIAVAQDGLIKYLNPQLAEMVGYTVEEMLSRPFLDFTHPDDRQMAVDNYFMWQRGESQASRYQFRFLRKDGSTGWSEMSAALLQWEGRMASLAMVNDITERVRAEQALAESEEKYRLLVDNANQGTTVIQDGLVAFVNPKLAQITGYAVEELRSRNFLDLLHPDDREMVRGYYSRRIGGQVFSHVYSARLLHRNGDPIWAEINAVLISWGGRPAVLALVTDITERRQAQEALAASEAKYRDLFEHTLLGMEVVDARTGKVVLANRSMARIFGFRSPADMVGDSIMDHVLPEDRESVAQQVAELMQDPSWDRVATVRSTRADGRVIWVTGMTTEFEYEGQKAMLVSLLDATAAKEAELKLHEREEQYRLLVDNATEAIAVLQDGRIRFGNDKFMKVSGYSPDEFTRAPSFLDLVHPDDRKMVAEYYVKRLMGREVPSTYQFRFLSKTGEIGWTEVNVTLVPWEGKPATLCLMDIITERKEAEESLRESERRYRLLAENATDIIWATDADLNVTYVSPSVTRIMGYSVEEIMSGPLDRLLTPTSLAFISQTHHEGLEREGRAPGSMKERSVEVEMVRRDGTLLWLEAALNVVRDDGGRFAGFQGACRDISGRRQAEDTLRDSEERNRMLVEHANEAVTVLQDGLIMFGNPKLESVSAYSSAELLRKPFLELVHPDDRGIVMDAFYRTQEEDIPNTLEFRLLDKGGNTHWVRLNAALILWEGGLAVLALFADITERKKAEAELRHSEERLSLALQAASAGMFDWNMITGEMHFSDRFYTMLGYSPGELPATYESFEALWHPDEKQELDRVIDRYRNNQTDHHEIEMRLRTKSGEFRWVASHGRLVSGWGPDARPARLVGAQFDITQRKEMENQILRAHAELEARVEQRTSELKEANRLLIDEIRQRQQAQKRLQESESKYRELVENANSIIMELDTRGRVTFFNRFAEDFYGFKEAEIVGRHVVGTIAPPVDSSGKDMKALTRDLVRHPEGYFVTENEGMRRNGERVWISWTNKGLHDAEGRLRNILCIGMDRTEQRRVADMLAEQLREKAAADERQRLARDLHDAVTQTLFSASLIAEVLPRLWRKDRPEARRRLEELRRLTRGALAEMRMLLLELRPGALGEVGLVELLRQLTEAIAAQTRLRLELRFRGKCGVPAEVQVALYRVAQEALNNLVKHSGATEAEVRLSCRAGVAELTVSDNGSGFDPRAVSPRSLGLRIMHERVEAVSATLKIEGRAGGGTSVRAVWSDGRRKGDS